MINALYWSLFVGMVLYLLFESRKSIAFLICLYIIFQYGATLAFWRFQLSFHLSIMLFVFLLSSGLLLIWVSLRSSPNDSYPLHLFLSVSQWFVILFCLGVIVFQSPYEITENSFEEIERTAMTFKTGIKLCGNLLTFTTFLLIFLRWDQRWTFMQSIRDLGPIILYTFEVIFLAYYKPELAEAGLT